MPGPRRRRDDGIWSPQINEKSKDQVRAVRLPQMDNRKPLAKAEFPPDQQTSPSFITGCSSTTSHAHSPDSKHHNIVNLPSRAFLLNNHNNHIRRNIQEDGIHGSQGMELAIERTLREKASRQLSRERFHTSSTIPQQGSPHSPQRKQPRGFAMAPRRLQSTDGSSDTPQSGSSRATRNAGPMPSRLNGFRTGVNEEWRTWVEVRILLYDLPPYITTYDLAQHFRQYGHIRFIDISEDQRGVRHGNASVRFSPPPEVAFWNNPQCRIPIAGSPTVSARLRLDERPRTFLHPSPVNPRMKYPELMIMHAESLDFGVMLNPTTMLTMKRIPAIGKTGIQFRQNLLHRELNIEFQLQMGDEANFEDDSNKKIPSPKEVFKFRIPFSHLGTIHRESAEDNKLILLFSMETPPKFFKQLDSIETHDPKSRTWGDSDAWYRQTDVVRASNKRRRSPVTLRKTHTLLDLGRWTTYRLVFDMRRNSKSQFEQIQRALNDYNVRIVRDGSLKAITTRVSPIWHYIDMPSAKSKNAGAALSELVQDFTPQMAFEVRYQLEVCISHGYLSEYNLTEEFAKNLAMLPSTQARDLLEFAANQKKRFYDPMSLFDLKYVSGSTSTAKIPDYCSLIRSAIVTPTTVYFNTPTVETSNRVIRQYAGCADHFLRVRFTDEKTEGKIFSTHKETMNEVFTRIKRAMTNGIKIGDRHYQFLAFGNSQFREHGAYFFAPLPYLDTGRIRKWMGMFEDIKTVAKYASRLGLCFSTTRAISNTGAVIVEMPDIVRNQCTFTDGVGRISQFLAQITASELGILQASQEPPSVFQFRLGGCKGVLAICPASGPREIHIRKSQYKFPASHEGLEIIRTSQYASANLNRQLILILSALGIPDKVFVQKLQLQLADLEQAMTDEEKALQILQRRVDHNQTTLKIASMILDGFHTSGEPFTASLLQLWRTWTIKYLKEKARITIDDGAFLLGCVDETATLKGHYNSTLQPPDTASAEEKAEYVPQVFVQLSKDPDASGNVGPRVILGPMLLARNPSLHPGDIRVVCGVDVPQLHHLKDVVVLPQTGDRDIAGMCSGGDLDGDDFIVIWDQDLLPHEWNREPMDYTAPPPLKHKGGIGTDDLTTFFVTYMKNDKLGTIAQAHVANADWLEDGVKDDKCLQLAQLHSKAVDFVKTGQPAHMTRDLDPPKWPHFMEKKNKPREKIYTSRKILGQLYDRVERTDFKPAFNAPFDKRILGAYDLGDDLLQTARQLKADYDAAMRRIMAQHEIKTEYEVWSCFVLEHSNTFNDYKFHDTIGQISTALQDQYRELCAKKAGEKGRDQLEPFVAAMYKVTAEEMEAATKECNAIPNGNDKVAQKKNTTSMPLMSFPWLFQNVLGKIAKANMGTQKVRVPSREIDGLPDTKKLALGKKTLASALNTAVGDDLETTKGVVHYGDVFKLFGEVETPRPAQEQASALNLASLQNDLASSTSYIADLQALSDSTLASNLLDSQGYDQDETTTSLDKGEDQVLVQSEESESPTESSNTDIDNEYEDAISEAESTDVVVEFKPQVTVHSRLAAFDLAEA